FKARLLDAAGGSHHGHLDEVSCAALQRRIDCHAFGRGSLRMVARAQVGQVTTPAEQRRHVAGCARLSERSLDVPLDLREAGEVLCDELARLGSRYAGALREPE